MKDLTREQIEEWRLWWRRGAYTYDPTGTFSGLCDMADRTEHAEAELAEAKKRQHMSDLNYDVLERALARSQGVEADLAAMLIRTERAEAELAKWKDAERRLSDAYLRLRGILGAWETPNAPTAEQVWVHTEAKARELAALRAPAAPEEDK